jgi:pseudoazurin
MLKKFIPIFVAGAAITMAGQAAAAEHVVQMLNTGAGGAMVFEPAVVKAKPGDTIRYVPTNPGHNAELIAGMLPAGVTAQKGAMGKEFVLKVTAPGVYGVKCMPHYSSGMVSLVQVGAAAPNLDAAKAVADRAPNFAKRRFTQFFTQLR